MPSKLHLMCDWLFPLFGMKVVLSDVIYSRTVPPLLKFDVTHVAAWASQLIAQGLLVGLYVLIHLIANMLCYSSCYIDDY